MKAVFIFDLANHYLMSIRLRASNADSEKSGQNRKTAQSARQPRVGQIQKSHGCIDRIAFWPYSFVCGVIRISRPLIGFCAALHLIVFENDYPSVVIGRINRYVIELPSLIFVLLVIFAVTLPLYRRSVLNAHASLTNTGCHARKTHLCSCRNCSLLRFHQDRYYFMRRGIYCNDCIDGRLCHKNKDERKIIATAGTRNILLTGWFILLMNSRELLIRLNDYDIFLTQPYNNQAETYPRFMFFWICSRGGNFFRVCLNQGKTEIETNCQ